MSKKKSRQGPAPIPATQKPDRKQKAVPLPVGLLVTEELNTAIEECKAKVDRISKDCRAKNRKYRDLEFDIENDALRCLNGLGIDLGKPSDVQRVTDIFDDPRFFEPGGTAKSNDIIQGELGDCWFLSALAAISTMSGLVDKICVARDEAVGVYGFIFYRESGWVSVVVDDLLFTKMPKFEELSVSEQSLYHGQKELFNEVARKNGNILAYARSGNQGETWVPLIEKAYAKFYGNYSHLSGGNTGEAIEDLTGGVSSVILTKDIFDINRFWEEELLRANQDRIFSCGFSGLSNERNGAYRIDVQGLIANHAYSILRAVEFKGKRFVVVRNPWGKTEWTGPWSDGSKEWTGQWLEALPHIGHIFGNDGQFVMEYKDFLKSFDDIDRTLLFDSTWVISSYWLSVPVAPFPAPWSYGDVSFMVSIPSPTRAIIVLSQLNSRFFNSLKSPSRFSLDFALVKVGDSVPLDFSANSIPFHRSVNLTIDLDAGDYYVYVRIDHSERVPKPKSGPPDEGSDDSNDDDSDTIDSRQLTKLLSDKVQCQLIAENFNYETKNKFIPYTLEEVIARDLDVDEEPEEEDENENAENAENAENDEGDAPEDQLPFSFKGPDQFEGLIPEKEAEVIIGLWVYTGNNAPAIIKGRLGDETGKGEEDDEETE